MAKLAKFNEIVRDFNDVADFAIIYISEAHAKDGWAFKVSWNSCSDQTRTRATFPCVRGPVVQQPVSLTLG